MSDQRYSPLADPKARRVYVVSKVVIFVIAAGLTWPLSLAIGNKAWIGLGAFGLALATVTGIVLAASGRGVSPPDSPRSDSDDESEIDTMDEVVLPVEDSIDLHSFPPRDVPKVVEDYLEEAMMKGFDEVRLIHGRGIGVQRERVRSVLAKHSMVIEYYDAPPQRGGWGATVVRLKSRIED